MREMFLRPGRFNRAGLILRGLVLTGDLRFKIRHLTRNELGRHESESRA
jgi:hypothetical protein